MSIERHATHIGLMTLLSRILGFVRDILMANFLGTSFIADAFLLAFKLPNMFRRIFAEGAFNAAFIPIFANLYTQNNKQDAELFARLTFSFMTLIMLIFVGLAIVAMPYLLWVIAPGFDPASTTYYLAVDLARIVFPYLGFIALVTVLSGILQTMGHFTLPAAAPMLLNLCFIGALLFYHQDQYQTAYALAFAGLLAGLLQLLLLLVAVSKQDIVMRLTKLRCPEPIKRLARKMVPGIIGAGVMQINVLIDTLMATLVTSGVSYLYYADRLSQFPLAIIGTAMGTVLLPSLTNAFKKNHHAEALTLQNRALEFALLLTLPAAAALMTIATPIIQLLFERGAFTASATIASAHALMAYALGLPAFVLVKVLTPSFFARGDTMTPVKIALICFVINLLGNILLIGPLQHVGLALATSISVWVNVVGLVFYLTKQQLFTLDVALKKRILGMGVATIIMVICVYSVYLLTATWYAQAFIYKLAGCLCLVIVGITSYFTCVIGLKVVSLGSLKGLIGR